MKKIIILLFTILIIGELSAQEYYHKFYNFAEVSRHLPWSFVIEEDDLVLKVGMDFCDEASPCTTLVRVEKNTGDKVDVAFIDILSKFSEEALLRLNDNYYLFGKQAPFTNRPSIFILDDNLSVLERIELDLKVDGFRFVEWGGMVERNGYFYAMANVSTDFGGEYGLLAKFDAITFEHEKNILVGNLAPDGSKALDLQMDDIGNLYIFTAEDWDTGNGMSNRNVISKININDDVSILDSYADFISVRNPDFLVLDEDNFLYSKFESEFPHTRNWNDVLRGLYYGADSLSTWFFEFPFEEPDFLNNPDLLEFRNYDIFDIAKTRNGDILVCGNIEDTPDSPALGGPYTADDWGEDLPVYHGGFITRLTKYGELLWQRVFIFTNTTNPDVLEAGFEFKGDLLQVVEDNNGDIYAFGRKTTRRNNATDPPTPPMDSLWILKTDRNGCLDASDCDTEEILTSVKRNISRNSIAVSIRPNPVSGILSIDSPVALETYTIHNSLGQLIQSGEVVGKTINVSKISRGIHFVTVYTKDNKSRTEKIIKN